MPRRDIRMLWAALMVKAEKLDNEARISTLFIKDYATEAWRPEHADAGRLMVYEGSHVSAAVMMYRDAENTISVRGEVLKLRVSNEIVGVSTISWKL